MLLLPLDCDPSSLSLHFQILLGILEALDLVCFGDKWSLD